MCLAVMLIASLGAQPFLEAGARAYERQDYEQAVRQLRMAFGVAELERADRRRAAELLAKSYLALGQRFEAVEVFASLVQTDPRAPQPEGSPKVRDAFLEGKRRVYSGDYVKLRQVASTPREVVVALTDPWERVATVTLYESDGGPFRPRELVAQDDLFRATLAPSTARYYLEARGTDRSLATVGGADAPLEPTEGPTATASLTPQPTPAPAVAVMVPAPTVVTKVNETPAPRAPWLKWLTGGVALASFATAAVLFVSSSVDSNLAGKLAFAAQRKAADDAAIDKAIAGWVFTSLGAVATAGTVALWVF